MASVSEMVVALGKRARKVGSSIESFARVRLFDRLTNRARIWNVCQVRLIKAIVNYGDIYYTPLRCGELLEVKVLPKYHLP